jgi:hypothetical protein
MHLVSHIIQVYGNQGLHTPNSCTKHKKIADDTIPGCRQVITQPMVALEFESLYVGVYQKQEICAPFLDEGARVIASPQFTIS